MNMRNKHLDFKKTRKFTCVPKPTHNAMALHLLATNLSRLYSIKPSVSKQETVKPTNQRTAQVMYVLVVYLIFY